VLQIYDKYLDGKGGQRFVRVSDFTRAEKALAELEVDDAD
jgi:hypothetical protein